VCVCVCAYVCVHVACDCMQHSTAHTAHTTQHELKKWSVAPCLQMMGDAGLNSEGEEEGVHPAAGAQHPQEPQEQQHGAGGRLKRPREVEGGAAEGGEDGDAGLQVRGGMLWGWCGDEQRAHAG